jgi:hypothetical protein
MRTLQKGMAGLDVGVWQKFLGIQGHSPGPIDGIFGNKTELATKAFQGENGLTQQGQVDTGTLIRAADLGFFKTLVRIPQNVNDGLTMIRQTTLLNVLGEPCKTAGDGCRSVTNQKVRNLLATQNIGPFSTEGLRPALDALTRAFANVQAAEPELYPRVGSAGMLCCRRVSLAGGGFAKTFSNHAWGIAIDFKINGELDERADGLTQYGLLLLHPFLKAEKFFWGAGFGLAMEDSMHFEVSEDLIADWAAGGII